MTTGKGDRNGSLVERLIRWPRPLKQTVSVAAIGTRRLGGIFGGPLPGPATLDLGFEGKTEKGSNRHDAREQPDALERERGGNCRDDVRADKQLKSKHDAAPDVGTVTRIGGSPVARPCAAPDECHRGRKNPAQDDRD